MKTLERRFVRGPSVLSGSNCLENVVDMGPLAGALSTDVPGLGERVLAMFPGMHDFAEPLQRGSFIGEVVGRIALELQRMAGAPARSRGVLTVHGKRGQVRIIVDGHVEQLVVQAFELASSIVLALCAGKKVAIRARLAALTRLARAGLKKNRGGLEQRLLPARQAREVVAHKRQNGIGHRLQLPREVVVVVDR
jgi:hypothetical protein